MTYKVVFTHRANQDFYSILDYIAQDSPVTALKFIDELQGRIKTILSSFPLSGKNYKDSVRYFVFGNYIAVYEVQEAEKEVTVYMVSERHRHWQAVLNKRL